MKRPAVWITATVVTIVAWAVVGPRLVEVRNVGGEPIWNVKVSWGSTWTRIGDVAPGESRRTVVWWHSLWRPHTYHLQHTGDGSPKMDRLDLYTRQIHAGELVAGLLPWRVVKLR